MSTTVALGVIGGCAVALLLWYLRRPPRREVRIAAWRFLGELSPASKAPVRPSLASLLRSHWLAVRLLVLALAAVPFFLSTSEPLPEGRPRVGLRLVIDVSASMAVQSGAGTRLDEARHLARTLVEEVAALEPKADVCMKLVTVGARAQEAKVSTPAELDNALAMPRAPSGGTGTQLVAQAMAHDPSCPPTHAVVISDLRRPSIEAGSGRALLWWQVGEPLPNIGLTTVAIDTPLFQAGPPTISVALRRVGGAASPGEVRVLSPSGQHIPVRTPDWTAREESLPVLFEASTPGRYVVELERNDAYAGDNRLTIDVPETTAPTFDWRLADVPRPPALRAGTGTDSILVAPIAMMAQAQGRRSVLMLGPLEEPRDRRRLGVFISGDPLLADVNLEIIDRTAPPALSFPGEPWIRVVEEDIPRRDHAGILVARRNNPSSVIIPAPPRTGSEQVRNAGYLLLFNAIRYVTAGHLPALVVRRTAADDSVIQGADLETDTAVPRGADDRAVKISPVDAAALPSNERRDSGPPLWPWSIVLLLGLLIVERWFGVSYKATA